MTVISVLNAGGWGTALAALLERNGHEVRLWARRSVLASELAEHRANPRYLAGVDLGPGVHPTSNLGEAVAGCQIVALVPISAAMRELAQRLAGLLPAEAIVVHGTKGLETSTLMRMSQVIESELGSAWSGKVAALSGPTHAEEVGRGIPTAAVMACQSPDVGRRLQQVFNSGSFRVYTNTDIIGVEVCAAAKNVIALAAGIGDGMGGGDNAKAALMTRGLAEVRRLVVAAGGRADTVAGLAGIGDLVATCTSRHSRNRRAGEMIGQGRDLSEVLTSGPQVVEGVPATRALVQMAERFGVEMPIAAQVYAILFEGRSPTQALADLMARDPTGER